MRAGGTVLATPADLVREACDLVAGYLPRLEELTPEPDIAECAAPGMTARPPAAPVPGNPQAFYAYTAIGSSARWAEDLLLYAVGAAPRDEDGRRGGSDANTIRVLTMVIPRLAAGAGDDTLGLLLRELGQRLDDARQVAGIDEARHWRALPKPRACPYCGCWFLKADMDARPVIIMCHTVGCQDGNGLRPVATMGTDGSGVPELQWADGTAETVPDLDG
jgi:hypothetical protein